MAGEQADPMTDDIDEQEMDRLMEAPSHEWREAHPGHCYICHLANWGRCGPHCGRRG